MKKTQTKPKAVKRTKQSQAKKSTSKKLTKSKKTTASTRQSSRVQGTIKRSLSKKEQKLREVELAFYAPLATVVQVAGSFNEWDGGDAILTKDSGGTWRTKMALKPGRYEYRYLIDGNWENAQSEHELVDNGLGGLNSILTVS